MAVDAPATVQRPPAERLYGDELDRLAAADAARPRPPGWRLAPESVLAFVLGDADRGLEPKFVGARALVETCIVTLATARGLMLIGEPGTAKSRLSELLAAAICGDSTLTIQGSAATADDHICYGWNYALLLAEGPGPRALVPAPLYRGMRDGLLVRFEELTRCPVEVQDGLLAPLSDRVMQVPEMPDTGRSLFARPGFNLIATANIRDRGVNEMSAALKRRFNFVTVPPIPDLGDELALVRSEADRALAASGLAQRLPEDIAAVLVAVFRELRQGRTADGQALEPMSTAMSTAEAVVVGIAAVTRAAYFADGDLHGGHLLDALLGTAFKDVPEDRQRLAHYLLLAGRRPGPVWARLAAGRAALG